MEWNKKIAQFQNDPPPLAWGEIEIELLKHQDSVYNFRGSPPENSWDEITTKLTLPEKDAPVVSFRNFRSILRYAAILVFVALIGTTIINTPFRNAVIESFRGPGMKASLADTIHNKKNDSSSKRVISAHQP